MKILKFIFFVLCLYIYLYNPIFKILGFGVIKILLLISFVYLLLNKSIISTIRNFKIELLFTLILVFYSFPLGIFGDGTTVLVPYTHIIWFLECFIIPIFLLTFFNDIFKKYSWESIVVLIGAIASLITLYLIINPDINSFIRGSVIIETLDAKMVDYDFRGFSISENSSYDYGIVQGIINLSFFN